MATDPQLVLLTRKNRRGGKKGRKIGQNKKKPCHVRYTEEKRWLVNKSKRVRRCNGEAAWLAWSEAHGF